MTATTPSNIPTNTQRVEPIASSSASLTITKQETARTGRKPQELVITDSDNATYVKSYVAGAMLTIFYFSNLFAIHWKAQPGNNGTLAEFNKAWKSLSKDEKEVC